MKIFKETIDGSIKDVIQLKTVDNSLEYSQMFDALDDCPDDFKSKLTGALNTLGENMGIPPTDAFNKALCASDDENEDVRKKLYNWWRAVFEVVAKSGRNVPKDRAAEYGEKVDAVMAEVCKAGENASGGDEGEVVLEDYEPADVEDEKKLVKEMEFAISKLGELAKKVQELVNFLNPYCKDTMSEAVNPDANKAFDEEVGRTADFAEKLLAKYRELAKEYIQEKGTKRDGKWGGTLSSDNLWRIQANAMRIWNEFADAVDWQKLQDKPVRKGVDWDTWCAARDRLDGLYAKGKRLREGFSMGFRGIDDIDKVLQEASLEMKTVNERDGDWISMDKLVGMEVGESLEGRTISMTEDEMVALIERVHYSLERQEERFDNEDDIIQAATVDAIDSIEWITGKHILSMDKISWTKGGDDDSADKYEKTVRDFVKDEYYKGSENVGESSISKNVFITYDEMRQLQRKVENDVDKALAEGELEGSHLVDTCADYALGHLAWITNEDVDMLDPADVLISWTDAGDDPDEDGEFNVANASTQSVYEFVKDVAERVRKDKETPVTESDNHLSFKVGDKVCWIDPDGGDTTCGWEVIDVDDEMIVIKNDAGSLNEVLPSEIKPESEADGEQLDADQFVERMIEGDANTGDVFEVYDGGVDDGGSPYLNVVAHKESVSYGEVEQEFNGEAAPLGWKFESFKYSSDMVDSIVDDGNCALIVYFKPAAKKVDETGLENELDKGDDGWREVGQPVGEATVVVDADDVWDVLDLLDDPDANKNLTDLINSHVRTEEEIMDAIDSRFGAESPTKAELNDVMRDFGWIVSALGLDVGQFKKDGSFVDPQKPVTLEDSDGDKQKPDEVKGDDKKFKQDGETKTLVTGEKKVVSEMTIEQEVYDPWKLVNLLWGQGKDNFQELLDSKLFDDDTIMDTLEQFEIKELSNLNDFLAYEFENFLEALGCDKEAWVQHLEIVRK